MQFLRDGHVFVLVFFFVIHHLKYCMLEDSLTKYEMCDMYVCVKDVCGKTLVGRNRIGTEILTSVL